MGAQTALVGSSCAGGGAAVVVVVVVVVGARGRPLAGLLLLALELRQQVQVALVEGDVDAAALIAEAFAACVLEAEVVLDQGASEALLVREDHVCGRRKPAVLLLGRQRRVPRFDLVGSVLLPLHPGVVGLGHGGMVAGEGRRVPFLVREVPRVGLDAEVGLDGSVVDQVSEVKDLLEAVQMHVSGIVHGIELSARPVGELVKGHAVKPL